MSTSQAANAFYRGQGGELRKYFLFLIAVIFTTFIDLQAMDFSFQLENDKLQMLLDRRGQFSLRRSSDGAWLLYPGSTSYVSVEVEGNVYSHVRNSLTVVNGPLPAGDDTMVVSYDLPMGVKVDQILALRNGYIEIKFVAMNYSSASKKVKIRVLLDTQIDLNDGSPLYGPGIGLQITERSFAPGLSSWRSYDDWPTYKVQSICTYSSTPELVLFAFWPNAKATEWTYNVDANRPFFAPGKTKSEAGSDSCVLTFFDLGTIEPNSSQQVSFYYGEEAPQIDHGREGVKFALEKLEQAFLDKIDSDLRLLAKYHARSFKAIFNFKDVRENIYSAQGAKREIRNIVIKALQIFAQDIFGHSANAASSLLTAPLTFGAKMAIDSAEQINAVEFYANLFYKYHHGGCQPDTSYVALEDCIYQVIKEDQIINVKNRLSKIRQQFKKLYELCEKSSNNQEFQGLIKLINRLRLDLERSRVQEITAIWPSSDKRMVRFGKFGLVTTFSQFSKEATAYDQAAEPIRVVGYSAAVAIGLSKVVLALCTHGLSIPAEILAGAGAGFLAKTVTDLAVNQIDFFADAASGLAAVFSIFCFTNSEFPNAEKAINETLAFSELALNDPEEYSYDSQIALEEMHVKDVAVTDESSLANAQGHILLANHSSRSSHVAIFLEVLGPSAVNQNPISLLHLELNDLPPQSKREIAFTLDVPSMKVWNQCREYVIKAWIVGDYGPVVMGLTEFAVGQPNAIAALDQTRNQTLLEGIIAEGEKINCHYTISENSGGAYFYVVYEGSDLDLHIYDQYGHHVGLNYATGMVENQIPGVTYSGSNSENEWILVNGHQGEIFDLEVIGVDVPIPERFVVGSSDKPKSVPAMLGLSASPLTTDSTNDSEYTGSIIVSEYGGTHGISKLAISVDGARSRLNPSGLRIGIPQTTIAPGAFIHCTVALPKSSYPSGSELILIVEGIDSETNSRIVSSIILSLSFRGRSQVATLYKIIFLMILISLTIIIIAIMKRTKKPGQSHILPSSRYYLNICERDIPLNKTTISVGRSKDNDVVINSSKISKKHFEIRFVKEGIVLNDLGSKNGTYLNGRRISSAYGHVGDVIEICGYKFTIKKYP